jgi:nucleotide-binding universal stress UspA family protein
VRPIVVGTDGSPSADVAVARAVEIAKGAGRPVHLVTAYPAGPSYGERIVSSAKSAPVDIVQVAESVLARESRAFEDNGIEVVTHARGGDPAEVLIAIAEEVGADLIVVGARGLSGLQRFMLGSVSSKLSHHAPMSVLVVRDQ